MIDVTRELTRVRRPLLAVSALAWALLIAASAMRVTSVAYCSAALRGTPSASLSRSLQQDTLSALAAGWALMLVAMMSPLIVPEIHHVRLTSFASRRARSIALFVAGYGGVWMLGGAVLTAIKLSAVASTPSPFVLPLVVGIVASIWQASPLKQSCLNGCHDNRPLQAFGLAADVDVLRFGAAHGLWCVGSCGGLMLSAMLLPGMHLQAMAVVAILVFCERLEGPKPPSWQMRGLVKAGRIVSARLRLHLRRLSEGPSGSTLFPWSKDLLDGNDLRRLRFRPRSGLSFGAVGKSRHRSRN